MTKETTPRCTGTSSRTGEPCQKAPIKGVRPALETQSRHWLQRTRLPDRSNRMTNDNPMDASPAKSTPRKAGAEPPVAVPHQISAGLLSLIAAWPARFRSKVNVGAGCWEWTACRDSNGYGRYGTTRARGTQPAHRMALELLGVEVAGFSVDHLCRNPSCVRPDHLEPVTQRENVRRGRAANAAGWCRSGRHEWVPENILIEMGNTRRCRPCRDERERAYRPPRSRSQAPEIDRKVA